jgi:hypothetical protein
MPKVACIFYDKINMVYSICSYNDITMIYYIHTASLIKPAGRTRFEDFFYLEQKQPYTDSFVGLLTSSFFNTILLTRSCTPFLFVSNKFSKSA